MISLLSWPRQFWQRDLLPLLADLKVAIVLLLAIAIFSIAGTVIEQGQSVAFYQANYPEDPALFGFLSWKVLLMLGLDQVYWTWWFLALLILFGSSLIACTFTRQLPALTAARTWKYYRKPRQFEKLALSTTLSQGSRTQLVGALERNKFKVFQEESVIYARKGIVGRIGPIVVHASMILILLGAVWGTMTGFMAQEMIPSGATTKIEHIVKAGPWSRGQIPQDWAVHVNRFWIDYTPEGQIDQFYSDLSILDDAGEEVDRQTIHVNKPLKHQGVTLYQADWSIAAVQARVNDSPIFQLPMAPLNTQGSGRIWGTWLPTKPDMSDGVSLLTQDLQGTLMVYDKTGQPVSSIRKGMALDVNGVTITVVDVIGSTGLQVKADPGIPLIYGGFGLLMLGVIMSYVSHSQVWVLEQDGVLYVGGRTNRAQLTFEQEFIEVLEEAQAPLASEESQDGLGTLSVNG